MVSEIYACGHNGVSAFLIVECDDVLHYGSYSWGDTISFDGCSMQTNDVDCEIMAVICGLMMCRNNNRKLVNIYTDSPVCQQRYRDFTTASVFLPSLRKACEGLDIHAESFADHAFGDDFKQRCLDMIKIK
jgi:hypothetical protein